MAKKNIIVWVLLALVTDPALARARTNQNNGSYFSATDFAKCVVEDLNTHYELGDLRTRLKRADELRVEAGKELLSTQENGSFMGALSRIAPYSQQDMSEVMAFHSMPLLNYEKINWGKGQYSSDNLNRLTQFYDSLKGDRTTDLTILPNFQQVLNEKVPERQMPLEYPGVDQKFIKMLRASKYFTDPLVDMLMKEKPESLTHYELLKKVTNLYGGDVLTALGAIGQVFDMERVNVTPRSKRLVLASRLKPLFPESKDKFGDNYHFWLYLNTSIQGKGRAAKLMSLTYEGLQGDFDDMKADNLGLDAGRMILKNLGKPASCDLKVSGGSTIQSGTSVQQNSLTVR